MIRIVPANEASDNDLELIFGRRGTPSWCRCQWFKIRNKDWDAVSVPERAQRLREQTRCGTVDAADTSGLVGYLDAEPAGWCAVEPRPAYPRLATSRLVWAGRAQDPDDASVWAVTCFVTRVGYRRRGVSAALAAAAVDFARSRGAGALEGYPIVLDSDRRTSSGDLYVGSLRSFLDAGFAEVSRPTPNRAVVRIDFSD
jgi:GNAT superfamily N-acetyltransferase